MKFSSSVALAATTVTILGSLSTPANAFLLTQTSASFDNAWLGDGKVVGQAETNSAFGNYEQAAFSSSSDNYVEFFERNGVSQVRWGDPAYNNYDSNKVQDGGNNYVWEYGSSLNAYGQEQYGWHKDRTAQKSGLGFAGIENLNLDVGQIFNLGTLKHYNNTIWSDNRAAERVDFSLNLGFALDEIGMQRFDFALEIDETRNDAGYHEGGVCPYQTDAGKGCSDKITWNFAVDQENEFTFDGEEYTLELVGFGPRESLNGDDIVEQFISQESGTSEASLWARLVKVNNPQEVPEPAVGLLGLGALGLYLVKSRQQKVAMVEIA
ncbi:MAG: choice-of-anchor K domain-containing protein [Cyanobacteria bacterium]|jgi:hypothetical protein|nr:choice-of-anchor K domain-containing protein [Cyanobacteriota bacterium]MDA0865034.1 choice-of-anchor K domain-containing protein [Cyanobacteriota bacterium]